MVPFKSSRAPAALLSYSLLHRLQAVRLTHAFVSWLYGKDIRKKIRDGPIWKSKLLGLLYNCCTLSFCTRTLDLPLKRTAGDAISRFKFHVCQKHDKVPKMQLCHSLGTPPYSRMVRLFRVTYRGYTIRKDMSYWTENCDCGEREWLAVSVRANQVWRPSQAWFTNAIYSMLQSDTLNSFSIWILTRK